MLRIGLSKNTGYEKNLYGWERLHTNRFGKELVTKEAGLGNTDRLAGSGGDLLECALTESLNNVVGWASEERQGQARARNAKGIY